MQQIARNRIVSLVHSGMNVNQIFKDIRHSFPNMRFSYGRIRRVAAKVRGRMFGVPERKRKIAGRSFNAEQLQNIGVVMDEVLAEKPETTSTKLQEHIKKKLSISISCSYLRRIRLSKGYRCTAPKYCHSIRQANKENRLRFCLESLTNRDGFLDAVFSDECTFQIENNTKVLFTKKGQFHRRLISRSKHPAKIHAWGGISIEGATALVLFDGKKRMNSELYTQILEEAYVPFNSRAYGGCARLVQDNAPMHVSQFTKSFLQDNGLETVKWPAESPDINPIELTWGHMKLRLSRMDTKPRTVAELKQALKDIWKELVTPEYCARLIQGIRWRMERIVQAGGRNIDECRKRRDNSDS